MSYGSPEWASWVLEEEEAIKHIKAAYATYGSPHPVFDLLNCYSMVSYDAGIQSFDTSDVRAYSSLSFAMLI